MNKMKIISLFIVALVAQQSFVFASRAQRMAAEAQRSAGGGSAPVVTPPVGPQPGGPKGPVTQAEIDRLKNELADKEAALKVEQIAHAATKAQAASKFATDANRDLPATDDKVGAMQLYAKAAGVDLSVDKTANVKAKIFVQSHSAGAVGQQSNTLGRLGNKASKHRYA